MTREEYMIKLKKYLRKLPKQDYEDAIEYFNEYFSDTEGVHSRFQVSRILLPLKLLRGNMGKKLIHAVIIFRQSVTH